MEPVDTSTQSEVATTTPESSNPRLRPKFQGTKCKGTKRNGEPCRQWAVHGRELCKYHGGAAVRGIGHGRFTDGSYVAPSHRPHRRYSLAGKMARGYEDILKDKAEILNATDEIALLLVRIQLMLDVQEQMPQVNDRVFRAYEEFLIARASGNVIKFQQAFGALDVAMQEAKEHVNTMRDFLPTIEALRRTRETEQKRRIAMRQMLTVEDARSFFRTVQGVVLECVALISDPVEQQAVKHHFSKRIEQLFTKPVDV